MKKTLFNTGIRAAALLLPLVSFAQRFGSEQAPTSGSQLELIIENVIGWAFDLLVFLTIVFVIVAAYKYLTAAGDPEKVKSASHTLIYAAVAIVIALLAKGLPLIIGSIVGVQITGTPGQ